MRRTVAAALSVGLMTMLAAQAQQPRQGNQQSGTQQGTTQQTTPPAAPPAPPPPAAPPAKPLVPIAASTLVATPDPYIGEPVSLAGAVDQNLSRTAFSVDQDRTQSTGKDVLILAPTLQRQLEPNTYVTVIGEALRFDPATIDAKLKEHKLDLSPELAAKYAGRPAVLATSVIDASGNDLARRLPPPLSADEEAYQKLMKQVGSSNAGLRKAIEGSDAKAAAEQTAALRKTFTEVEAFWRGRRKNDAAQWAQDARKLSENIERSVAASRWDDVKSHAGTLGKTCQACHAAYRERFDDGSFRIKKPT